jgi:hypothetical protein
MDLKDTTSDTLYDFKFFQVSATSKLGKIISTTSFSRTRLQTKRQSMVNYHTIHNTNYPLNKMRNLNMDILKI